VATSRFPAGDHDLSHLRPARHRAARRSGPAATGGRRRRCWKASRPPAAT